jgi:hypothetical protein
LNLPEAFQNRKKLDRQASKVAGAVLPAFQKKIVNRKFCWFENRQGRPWPVFKSSQHSSENSVIHDLNSKAFGSKWLRTCLFNIKLKV